MNLQELKEEIERLDSLKENREHCTIDTQLKAIKMVVEAVDILIIVGTNLLNYEDVELWMEIKELLNTQDTDKTLKGLKEFREKNWDKTLPLNEAYKKYIKIFEDKPNPSNTDEVKKK